MKLPLFAALVIIVSADHAPAPESVGAEIVAAAPPDGYTLDVSGVNTRMSAKWGKVIRDANSEAN